MFLDVFRIKKSGRNINGTAKKILSAAVLAVLYSGGSMLPEYVLNSELLQNFELVNFAEAARYKTVTSTETVDNLLIENYSDSSNGGAIYHNGGTLTINAVTFKTNTAAQAAGAIYSCSTGSLNITDSVFIGNIANGEGGGAIQTQSFTQLSGNVIFKNNISQKWGGAIQTVQGINFANDGNYIFDGNSITSSSSYFGGGALLVQVGKTNILSGTSLFINNESNTYGGAISVFSDNTVLKLSGTSYFVDNYEQVSGSTKIANDIHLGTHSASTSSTSNSVIITGTCYMNGGITSNSSKGTVTIGDSLASSVLYLGPLVVNGKILDNVTVAGEVYAYNSYKVDTSTTKDVSITNLAKLEIKSNATLDMSYSTGGITGITTFNNYGTVKFGGGTTGSTITNYGIIEVNRDIHYFSGTASIKGANNTSAISIAPGSTLKLDMGNITGINMITNAGTLELGGGTLGATNLIGKNGVLKLNNGTLSFADCVANTLQETTITVNGICSIAIDYGLDKINVTNVIGTFALKDALVVGIPLASGQSKEFDVFNATGIKNVTFTGIAKAVNEFGQVYTLEPGTANTGRVKFTYTSDNYYNLYQTINNNRKSTDAFPVEPGGFLVYKLIDDKILGNDDLKYYDSHDVEQIATSLGTLTKTSKQTSRNLTIDGGGKILDGNGKGHIFVNNGNTLTLKDITMKGFVSMSSGSGNSDGGVVLVGANSILNTEGTVVFDGNKANYGGGVYVHGIVNFGGTVIFKNNTSVAKGTGDIFIQNGATINVTGMTSLTNGIRVQGSNTLNIGDGVNFSKIALSGNAGFYNQENAQLTINIRDNAILDMSDCTGYLVGTRVINNTGTISLGSGILGSTVVNNGIVELNGTTVNAAINGGSGDVKVTNKVTVNNNLAGNIVVADNTAELKVKARNLIGNVVENKGTVVMTNDTPGYWFTKEIHGGTFYLNAPVSIFSPNADNFSGVEKIILDLGMNFYSGDFNVPYTHVKAGNGFLGLNDTSAHNVIITGPGACVYLVGQLEVTGENSFGTIQVGYAGRENTNAKIVGNVVVTNNVQNPGPIRMWGSTLTINEGGVLTLNNGAGITKVYGVPKIQVNGALSLTGSLNVGIATTVSESGTLQMGTGSLNSAVTNNGIIELHGTTLGAVINGGTGQKTGLVKIYDTVTANKKINADTLIIDDTGKLIAKKVDNLNTNNVNNYGTLEIGGTFGTAVNGKADDRGTLKFTGDALIGKSSSIVQPITYQDIDLGGYNVTVNTVAGGSLDATDNLNLNNGTIYVDGAVDGGGTGINKITLGTLTGNGCIKFNGQISASGTTSSIKVDTINVSSITGDMSIDLSSVNVVGSSTDEQWAVAQTKENIPFIVSAAPITTNLVINEAYNGTSDGHMYIFEQQSPNSGSLKVTKWYGYNLAQIITDNKATADPHYPSVIDTFSLLNNTNLLTDKVHVVNGATPSITGLVDHYVTLNASGGVISTNTNLGTLVQRTDTSHVATTRPFTINGNNYALDGGSNGTIKYDGFTVNAVSPEVFLKNIKEIRGFDKYFINNTGGTVNISGETQLNSILKGTGTYNLITGSILTVETLTNLAMTQINNSGTIKLGNATAQELTSSLATIGGIGDIIIAGNIISNAEKLSGSITINNDKQLILNGGAIKGDIQTEAAGAKNGALVITGNVTNTDTTVYDIGVKTLKINSGASLTTKANSLVGTENIINDATLTLTQDGTDIGYISADITGPTGTIIIDTGAIVNNSNNNIENILIVKGSLENYGNIAGAITVENGGNLESALEKLTSSTDIVNKGTLKIRGILNKGINKGTSAANGTIILTDDLVLSATISNQDIELNGHILTANTATCLDGTNKNNMKLNTYDTVALTEGEEGTLDTRGGSINNITIGTLSGKGKIKLDMQLNGSSAPTVDKIIADNISADTTLTLSGLNILGSSSITEWALNVKKTVDLVTASTGLSNLTIAESVVAVSGGYKYTMTANSSAGKVDITKGAGYALWQIVQNDSGAGEVSSYQLESNYTETEKDLGTLTRDIESGQSDTFEIDGRNYKFDGGDTYSGITVDTGLTLYLTNIAEISGWKDYVVNNQNGTVNIRAENVTDKTTVLNSKLQGSGTYNLISGSTLKVADAGNLAMNSIQNNGKIIVTGGTILPAAVSGTGTLEFGDGVNAADITALNKLDVLVEVKPKAVLNTNADNFVNNGNDINIAGTLNIIGGTLNKEIHAANGILRFSGNTTITTRQTQIEKVTIDSGVNITIPISQLGDGKSDTEAFFNLGTTGVITADGASLTVDAQTVELELGHYYTVVIGDAVVGTEFNGTIIDTVNSGNNYILVLANGEYGGGAVTPGKIYFKVVEVPIDKDRGIHNPELIKKYKAEGGEPRRLAGEIEKLYIQKDGNKKEIARTALNSISNLTELAEVTTNAAIFSNVVMDNTIEHASISNRSVIDRNNDSKIKNVANMGYEQVTVETIPVGMAADIIPQRLENPIYAKEIWASYLRSKNNIEDMKTGFLTKNGTNQINGVMVGADLWSNDRSFGGVSISYANSDINDSNIAAIVRNKVKNYSVGVYQRLDVNNTSALMMDLNYIQAKNDINMNVLSGYNITAEPKVNALNFGVRYETKFDLGKSSLLPYVGISYTRAKTGDYNNSYGDRYEVDNQNLVNVPVGLKWYGEYKIPESNLIWRPRIEGGYSWNIGGRDNRQYLNGKGLEFDVTDRGKYFLKTGFDIILRNVTCGLYYAYSKGEHVRSNRWNINLEWLF